MLPFVLAMAMVAALSASVWVPIAIAMVSAVLWVAYTHPTTYARYVNIMAIVVFVAMSASLMFLLGFSFGQSDAYTHLSSDKYWSPPLTIMPIIIGVGSSGIISGLYALVKLRSFLTGEKSSNEPKSDQAPANTPTRPRRKKNPPS